MQWWLGSGWFVRVVLILWAVLVAVTGTAWAGPWPRDAGGVFMSLSAEGDRHGNGYLGFYGEYGLTPRRTLGLELGHSGVGESSALIWLQTVLGGGGGPDHWTGSLGFGALERAGEYLPVGQLGLAWGRGWDAVPVLRELPDGGWLSVEARLKVTALPRDDSAMMAKLEEGAGLLAYITPEASAKLDVTLGWHVSTSRMFINQLRFEDRDDTGFSLQLASSLVQQVAGALRLELGLVAPLSGEAEAALRLGTWLEF